MSRSIRTLAGARVVVTGGAGLIGSNIVERLLSQDVREVIAFDNVSGGHWFNLARVSNDRRLTIVEADVRDRLAVYAAVDGADLVMHLASPRLIQSSEDPRLAVDVMVGGTLNVVEAAVRTGLPRVVFASSSSVYSDTERLPIAEGHSLTATTIDGAAKICGEGLLGSFHDTHSLEWVALRPFDVYGPRMDTHGPYTEMLVRWMDRIDRGLPLLIVGDGSQSMDLVYVDDVARAFVIAATAAASGEVFNVATGVETTLTQLANALGIAMASNVEIEYGALLKRPIAARRAGDVTLARERLAFVTETRLEDGLRRLVQWWRSPGRSDDATTLVPSAR